MSLKVHAGPVVYCLSFAWCHSKSAWLPWASSATFRRGRGWASTAEYDFPDFRFPGASVTFVTIRRSCGGSSNLMDATLPDRDPASVAAAGLAPGACSCGEQQRHSCCVCFRPGPVLGPSPSPGRVNVALHWRRDGLVPPQDARWESSWRSTSGVEPVAKAPAQQGREQALSGWEAGSRLGIYRRRGMPSSDLRVWGNLKSAHTQNHLLPPSCLGTH